MTNPAPAIHITRDLRPGPVPALFRRWTGWLAARNWYRAANLCQRVGWFTATRVRADWTGQTGTHDWRGAFCPKCGEEMTVLYHTGKDAHTRDEACFPCEDARAEAERDAN